MNYRIITYRAGFRVQYRGFSTLGLWLTHSWGGYGESVAEEYPTKAAALRAIRELQQERRMAARPSKIVHVETDA